ncbi:phycobilisome rod-core linker polypeptide [Crocosphaera sp. Alani8]|uniref:phycobilisome rod-core linker polypeptide n=1 Tax=Crocosphaera sp. Alani8 TaxID=3038952 RepID=UPI00313B4C01
MDSAKQRQFQSFDKVALLELVLGSDENQIETIIRGVYRQVLGNAHIMESERLTIPESQLKGGEISVREFVRQVAYSQLYRSLFFEPCPRYRSIELNFKHLLGRAPNDYSETFHHSQILDEGGWFAEIDSYIDSDEYQDNFGENIVPYCRGYHTQTGQKLLGFTNMFKLLPNVSTSDKANASDNNSLLNKAIIYNNPGGKAPVTDVKALIAQALNPEPTALSIFKSYRNNDILALQQECSQQKQEIERLQKELADLQPAAFLADMVLSKGFSKFPTSDSSQVRERTLLTGIPVSSSLAETEDSSSNSLSWQQKRDLYNEKIATLQEQIKEARRLAVIGNAQMNKWRNRYFSIR